MDNVDYSSQCESSNPGLPSDSHPRLDNSITEDEVDYEDDWPRQSRSSNLIKLNSFRKSRKGSPKCPFKMTGSHGTGESCYAEAPKSSMTKSHPRAKEKKQDNKALLARRRVIRLLIAVICSFALWTSFRPSSRRIGTTLHMLLIRWLIWFGRPLIRFGMSTQIRIQ